MRRLCCVASDYSQPEVCMLLQCASLLQRRGCAVHATVTCACTTLLHYAAEIVTGAFLGRVA
jgi:hypothetical protein